MPKIAELGRILALDFGRVRTGIAVTDELQLIASGLITVDTNKLLTFLEEYLKGEMVDCIVVGEPKQMDGTVSESEALILPFLAQLHKRFPSIAIARQDERFTSKMAMDAMIAGGMKKNKRRNKSEVDKISATLILQAYLDRK